MNFLQLIKKNQNYFEDFITRSTYHSNAIEGSTLSYAETYALLWNDNSLKVTAEPRELYGAINYKYALNTTFEHLPAPLSEKLIKQIAITLNKNVHEINGYRQSKVLIRGAEHIPPEPNQVNQLMMQLVHEYNENTDSNPFLREAKLHIRFERIHPFEDGNGRTGRILITRGLIQAGVVPAVIPAEKRTQYLSYLADCNYEGLAEMLQEASAIEEERMTKFEA